jgi:hypothetical protein
MINLNVELTLKKSMYINTLNKDERISKRNLKPLNFNCVHIYII